MKKNRMVMLVDESATFREIFMRGMLQRGFAPMVLASSGEALHELTQVRYDLVCSAMHLPDMEGTAFCAALRSNPRYAATPFFLFTADADTDVQLRVLPEGVTEVFHKNEVAELFNYIAHYPFDDQSLSGHVLLVEDERSLRDYLAEMLRRHGLQVTPCADADTAWPEFSRRDYDLVITDVVLTGQLSGPQLVRRIRRFHGPRGETPILAMTGFEDKARRLELFRAGINDYIAKPLFEQEFIARVNNLLLARQAMWAAMSRGSSRRLNDIRDELKTLIETSLTPEQRIHAETGIRLTTELEKALGQGALSPAGSVL